MRYTIIFVHLHNSVSTQNPAFALLVHDDVAVGDGDQPGAEQRVHLLDQRAPVNLAVDKRHEVKRRHRHSGHIQRDQGLVHDGVEAQHAASSSRQPHQPVVPSPAFQSVLLGLGMPEGSRAMYEDHAGPRLLVDLSYLLAGRLELVSLERLKRRLVRDCRSPELHKYKLASLRSGLVSSCLSNRSGTCRE